MKQLFFVLPILLISLSSFAEGGGVGNGGGVVICKDKQIADVSTTETHDLYEGRIKYHLTYEGVRSMSYQDLNQYLNQMIARNKDERKLLKSYSGEVFTTLFSSSVSPKELQNTLTEDLESEFAAGTLKLEEGCSIKNFYRYFNNSKSQMNNELLKGLGKNDFLVLQKHEVLYLMARRMHSDVTSERARTLLAYAASDQVALGFEKEVKVFEKLLEEWWK